MIKHTVDHVRHGLIDPPRAHDLRALRARVGEVMPDGGERQDTKPKLFVTSAPLELHVYLDFFQFRLTTRSKGLRRVAQRLLRMGEETDEDMWLVEYDNLDLYAHYNFVEGDGEGEKLKISFDISF